MPHRYDALRSFTGRPDQRYAASAKIAEDAITDFSIILAVVEYLNVHPREDQIGVDPEGSSHAGSDRS